MKFLTLCQKLSINLIVQINGKKKLAIKIAKGLTKKQTQQFVLENASVIEILKDKIYKKIIIIPDRVVNLVIK